MAVLYVQRNSCECQANMWQEYILLFSCWSFEMEISQSKGHFTQFNSFLYMNCGV